MSLPRRLAAEGIGSLLLAATVVGSGVMAERLAAGNAAIATFGLLLVILGHRRPQDAPWMVAAWIGAAYWFTASTSFANPAITIARSLSNTFSGIRPADVAGFIMAQLAGALLALVVAGLLFPGRVRPPVRAVRGLL
jgi:glycerol uptake facilitator-like aquaporin